MNFKYLSENGCAVDRFTLTISSDLNCSFLCECFLYMNSPMNSELVHIFEYVIVIPRKGCLKIKYKTSNYVSYPVCQLNLTSPIVMCHS